jgi:hypothetical protein
MSASDSPPGLMRICRSCRSPCPGRDVDDAIGVDVEGHLDLRHAARRSRNTDQIELAEQLLSAAISRSP